MKKERYDRVSKEWFEKGKLEQKKEELEFIEGLLIDVNIEKSISKTREYIEDRIKQLQKEIGKEKEK